MTTQELTKFFEKNDFIVYTNINNGVEVAEIENWTKGGVNMLMYLNPFTIDEFIQYVDDFDIDELIDLHRESKQYKNAFTISQSLADFTDYHSTLKELASELNNM